MTRTATATGPRVLEALAQLAREHPLERKRIVCARYGAGRELLRALAGAGVSWIGFELVTPSALAHELVADALVAHGLASSDEFDELALLDEAIDAVLGSGGGHGLAALAESHGLRQAIAASVQALRLAGIDAPALERARFRDEDKRAQIARILDEYEARLRRARRADAALVFRMAGEALVLGTATLRPAHYAILPGLARRGLPGALLEALLARGAVLLPGERVSGLAFPAALLGSPAPDDAPATALSWLHDVGGAAAAAVPVTLDMFAASSVTSELREVLRRVVAAGLQWDQVEIVATDAQAYGVALDGLARRLDIPVTYAAGLPLGRTRPGRAVVKFLEWVESDFRADLLRQMLERGDIRVPAEHDVTATALARLLRRLRVSRGRDAYARAFARHALSLAAVPGPEEERTEDGEAQRARAAAELDVLRTLVTELLALAPGTTDGRVVPAALARGLRALLDRVPAVNGPDRTAHARLCERLERLGATALRPAPVRTAVAILLAKLEARVPAPDASGGAPWLSAGGHLHLTDLEHGGWSGREVTFVVGLDAGRFPGRSGSDALLVDDDRRRLTAGQQLPALPTALDRLEERRHGFAQLLARLRGCVTLSYAAWEAVEGRTTAPAAEVLQAFRLRSGDRNADYDALHAALEPAASPVPRSGGLLDADDVWLRALAHEGGLRYGVPAVVALHPHLAAGVAGFRARRGPAGAWHGIIRARPGLDPRDDPARTVSATQLQVLGSCPLQYLQRYVLRVREPDDPEPGTDQWLSPLARGSLMHRIFERALHAAQVEDIGIAGEAFEDRALAIADEELEAERALQPPPGAALFALERTGVREDTRAFVAMVREDDAQVVSLEQRFGREGAPPVPVRLPDGHVLHLSGAIDRVDRLPDGRLVVIDYKTGSRARFAGRRDPFDGGRRLQHALYAAVAESLHGAEVARAEYHFPTRRSENHRARFSRQELRAGLEVVSELLELAARGWFLPTTDAGDCRICAYAAACRTRPGNYGVIDSPPVTWARDATAQGLDILRGLRR